MSDVLKTLTTGLDPDLRKKIQVRVEALVREIKYLQEKNDARLAELEVQGWNIERLEIICALNAFYQLILGPLASSARERTGVLGEEIPILYGELLRFDTDRNRKIRSTHQAFTEIASGLPGQLSLLTASHASDLVFALNKALTQYENN